MVIDKNVIDGFQNQIKVLTKLQDSVQGAINRANEKLVALSLPENFGKNIHDVIPATSNQGSATHVGGGQDHKDNK